MATQFTYPGVYIQEFAPGAPIPGVGTSTPAFIGPAASGDWNVPTKLASFDEFTATYGGQPLTGFYLWYAVQGFFQNGGQVCYIVRASNGTYGTYTLLDGSGNELIDVRARRLGLLNPNIQIAVAHSHLVSGASVYQPTPVSFTVSSAQGVQVSNLALAAQFRPGDSAHVDMFGDHVIARISNAIVGSATVAVFRFVDSLQGASVGETGSLRLSDSLAGATVFRILPGVPPPLGSPLPAGALAPGTMLTVTQGTSDSQMVAGVQTEYLQTTPPIVTYRVTLRNGLNIAVNQTAAASVHSEEFDLTVKQGTSTTIYDHLSIDPAHPRYYAYIVNGDAAGQIYANPSTPTPSSVPPLNLPAALAATAMQPGNTEDLTQLNVANYTSAIDTLQTIDDVNLIAAPDAVTLAGAFGTPEALQQYVISHCEQMGDRFGVLDSKPKLPLFGNGGVNIGTQREALDSQRGYAALYYPWLQVSPVGPGAPILVPPSGHVCGIIANTDNTRGVYKAPANAIVSGAVGLELAMNDADQGQINIAGINAIRQFQGGPPTVWGARTTATDPNWQYVNVRRLFIFLEKSIQEGIRWAVFEPNNTALWAKLKRTITEFLTRVWRDGALFGDTAAQAFYVRIDETLNPPSTRALGQLHIEIGVAPSYPAEFIVVRIGIWQGGSSVSEG
ncbi:MAG TPA: phage tail sheath subtilisin-like domain-containing protein [Bryobacteraceae bacterium]|nr:phage tail sheath subtilisin-like domain-containing protein [Bryobacteraceae bacterium]